MMPTPESSQTRPPSAAKSLSCPRCGDVAIRAFDISDNDGLPELTRTDCICANEHLWSVRWVAA